MNSIRSKILLWVFVLFLIIWTTITYATYYQSRHEVEELFDSELAQSAGVLTQISRTLDLDHGAVEPKLYKDVYGHRYEKKIAFQVISNDKLILYSANAPLTNMSDVDGFSDRVINDQLWRVFRFNDVEHNQVIITAEEFTVRDELVFEITKNSLYPLTLMIPILFLIIWIGIDRGLSPIRKLAQHINERSPDDFSPITESLKIPKEVKTLTRALNQLFDKLSHAFDRERRFTSDAAHELQTPLASIKTQTQVALRTRDEQQKKHALEKINDGVNRATHLVQQLLTLARLEPDAQQPVNEVVDVTALSQQILADFDTEAHKKQIELRLNAEDEARLNTNPSLLGMLIANLVSNAIRYTPEKGHVTVDITQDNQQLTICISDTGPGIPEEERERIFERFYRGPDNQHIMGSGLGLSIVQRILKMQKASIRLSDNTHEGGLKVCVQFPLY